MKTASTTVDICKYDFETDILFFRDSQMQYHSSIDIDDLIIDLSEDGTPVGAELLNASKNFGVSKFVMNGTERFKAHIEISETDIEVTIKIFVRMRNARVQKDRVVHGVNDVNIQPSQTVLAC